MKQFKIGYNSLLAYSSACSIKHYAASSPCKEEAIIYLTESVYTQQPGSQGVVVMCVGGAFHCQVQSSKYL